jgi:hypothetical protein
MLFKIVLAASAAIIAGLILFYHGLSPDQTKPSSSLPGNQSATLILQSGSGKSLDESDETIDPPLEQQIRLKAEEENQKVQTQLRLILDSEPVHFSEARKLLHAQRQKILLNRIALLGKDSIGEKPRAPIDTLTLRLLDKESKLIIEQLDLLAKADSSE